MESTAIVPTTNDANAQLAAVQCPVPIDVMLLVTQYLTLRQAREELEAQEKATAERLLERMAARDLTMFEHPLGMVLRVEAHERGQQLDVKATRELLAAHNLPIPMKPVVVRAHVKVLDLGRTAHAGSEA
jgi:hypothetical protein